jgi:hypothetical protein
MHQRGFVRRTKRSASKADGITISEKLPKCSAIMDKVTLIRSVHHTMKNHNSAGYYALTGHAPPSDDQRLRDSLELFPGYSSIVDRFAPGSGEMPTAISYPHVITDGSITPGQHASFLGKRHDPLLVLQDPNSEAFALPELSLPKDVPVGADASATGADEDGRRPSPADGLLRAGARIRWLLRQSHGDAAVDQAQGCLQSRR